MPSTSISPLIGMPPLDTYVPLQGADYQNVLAVLAAGRAATSPPATEQAVTTSPGGNNSPAKPLDFVAPDVAAGAADGGLRSALDVANDRIAQYEADARWRHDLLSNPHLSAQEKVAAQILRDRRASPALGTPWHPAAAERRVYTPELAKLMGVSPQSASTYLRRLDAVGAITYRVEQRRDPLSGLPRSQSFVALTDLFATPAAIQPTEDRQHWGGAGRGQGRKCKGCGGSNLRRKVVEYCPDCGDFATVSDVPITPPDAAPDDAPDMAPAGNSTPAKALDFSVVAADAGAIPLISPPQPPRPVAEAGQGLFPPAKASDPLSYSVVS